MNLWGEWGEWSERSEWSEWGEALNGYFFFTEISESVSEEISCTPDR